MPATQTATAAASHRLGFESLDAELPSHELALSGELPAWLGGSLLRTGPARFEVGERTLAHWFDGLAMLHRFSFASGRVAYANRFLRGKAFSEAERTGTLRFREFASDPCRSLFARVSTLFAPALSDNGAVNVARVGDRFMAMTETPLAVEFDPGTLRTAGVAPRPPGQLSTAHPHHDARSGELVNVAVALGPRSSYRFYARSPRGDGAPRVIASTPVREPGYVHSFGLTERHLVLLEGPLLVNPLRLALGGRPYIENYRWRPQRGTRLLVFERDGGRLCGTYEAEPCFCFHHVNAFEQDAELVVDALVYEDDEVVRALYLERLRGAASALPAPRLRRYRLELGSTVLREQTPSELELELPRIDYRRNGRRQRFVYGVGLPPAARAGRWYDRIVRLDVESRESRSWSEPGCYPGEPVFVAAPGGEEHEGVLLSVVLDAGRERSFLLVLDARDLGELARAEVPHAIPFGFHGQYESDV